MHKLFIVVTAALSLSIAACMEKEFGSETVVFLNFAPQAVVELNAYNCRKENNKWVKNDRVYASAKRIETHNYHAFDLPQPGGTGNTIIFFLEVKTEDGEEYGAICQHYGILYERFYLSVDYEIKHYED